MNDFALVCGRFTIVHQLQQLNSSSHSDICGEKDKKFLPSRAQVKWLTTQRSNRPHRLRCHGDMTSPCQKQGFDIWFGTEGFGSFTSKPAGASEHLKRSDCLWYESEHQRRCRLNPSSHLKFLSAVFPHSALAKIRVAEMFLAAQEIKRRSR